MQTERCRVTDELNAWQHRQDALELDPELIRRAETRAAHDLDRVIHVSKILLAGQSFYNTEHGETVEHTHKEIASELINHKLYDHALEEFVLGDPLPLEDLKIRVARQIAANILKIDPKEIGLGD
jgi:hypothetical protein